MRMWAAGSSADFATADIRWWIRQLKAYCKRSLSHLCLHMLRPLMQRMVRQVVRVSAAAARSALIWAAASAAAPASTAWTPPLPLAAVSPRPAADATTATSREVQSQQKQFGKVWVGTIPGWRHHDGKSACVQPHLLLPHICVRPLTITRWLGKLPYVAWHI